MSYIEERLRHVPTARIDISLVDGKIFLDGSGSLPAENGGPAIVDHLWSVRMSTNNAILMAQEPPDGEVLELTDEISAEKLLVWYDLIGTHDVYGEYYIQLTVKDEAGRQDTSCVYFRMDNGQTVIPDYDRENPTWVDNTIVYGVIPRMFGAPAFKAIMHRLADLEDLGVNAIWLAPINVSPEGDYGYAVKDYFELNPAYGTKEDFHHLVESAHAHNIMVLMDFVPNHSSIQHPYFVDTQEKGKDSPYWDFYDRDANGEPTHYFNWTHLPNLNYANPEVRRFMTEAFSYWVREFGVDGFRVDACWGVKQRQPDYWPAWRRELQRINPSLLLLAEASARDPYYFSNGFDAAYDWTDQLGKWAWEHVWDSYKNTTLVYNLDTALTNRAGGGYDPDALIFRFLNNNDTGPRFITQYGEKMARLATALLLTLPGIPCIYTGDELGEEFQPYVDEGPLEWKERYPGILDYHKKLIAIRLAEPGLRSRLWQRLEIKPIPQQVYGYMRYYEGNKLPLIVLLNFSEEEAKMEFTLPEQFVSMVASGTLRDLLQQERIQVGTSGSLGITVPAMGARILKGMKAP